MRYGHNSDKWGEHIGSPLPSVMSIFVGTDLRVCPIVIIFGYFVIMTKPHLDRIKTLNSGSVTGGSQGASPIGLATDSPVIGSEIGLPS